MVSLSIAFERWLELILLRKDMVDLYLTVTQVNFLGGISPLKLDYLIRFEHYEEDAVVLMRALGRKTNIVHENGSGSDNKGRIDGSNPINKGFYFPKEAIELLECGYRDLYTDRARALVETHFASDLDAFRYVF